MTVDPELCTDPRFGCFAVVAGYADDRREVVVIRRLYNTIVTIGPPGAEWIDNFW